MIKSSELRIGNIIGWRTGFGQLVTGPVFQIEADKIAISQSTPIDDNTSGQSFTKLDGVEPTPLTPEWLEKFGFITMDYEIDIIDWARRDTEKQFSISQNGIPVEKQPYIFEYENGYGDDIAIEIKYVHQLQNLHFALTGEELTIKELQP